MRRTQALNDMRSVYSGKGTTEVIHTSKSSGFLPMKVQKDGVYIQYYLSKWVDT